jgi:hypothetical protein
VLFCTLYSLCYFSIPPLPLYISLFLTYLSFTLVPIRLLPPPSPTSLYLSLSFHSPQVMNPRTRAMMGREEVYEKYGVPPELLCDLQALTGDSAVRYGIFQRRVVYNR